MLILGFNHYTYFHCDSMFSFNIVIPVLDFYINVHVVNLVLSFHLKTNPWCCTPCVMSALYMCMPFDTLSSITCFMLVHMCKPVGIICVSEWSHHHASYQVLFLFKRNPKVKSMDPVKKDVSQLVLWVQSTTKPGLYRGWKQTSMYLLVIQSTSHQTTKVSFC